ncbi:hypothetical protein EIP86_001670 [Pleurotus ostreatoroseus]|nr:hypothetical protein EIP86_001670 [Pleurotus ostreatoroseus]
MEQPPIEESFFANSAHMDRQILAAVDAVHQDDDLLCTVIWESFQEIQSSNEDMFQFICKILVHRGMTGAEHWEFPVDLRPLTYRVWNKVMRTLIVILRDELSSPYWQSWMGSALLLTMSVSNSDDWRQVSSDVFQIFHRLLASHRTETCKTLASSICFGVPDSNFEIRTMILFRNLSACLGQLGDNERAYGILAEIIRYRAHPSEEEAQELKLTGLFTMPWKNVFTNENLVAISHTVLDLIRQEAESVSGTKETSVTPWVTDAVSFVVKSVAALTMDSCDYFDWVDARLSKGFIFLCKNAYTSSDFIAALTTLPPSTLRLKAMLSILQKINDEEEGAYDIAKLFCVELISLCKALKNLRNLVPCLQEISSPYIDVLYLSHVLMVMATSPQSSKFLGAWRSIFDTLSSQIRLTIAGREDMEVAEICMGGIQSFEYNGTILSTRPPNPLETPGLHPELIDEAAYRSWRSRFDETKSIFPDNFIESLSTVARREGRWYRVRKLQEIE